MNKALYIEITEKIQDYFIKLPKRSDNNYAKYHSLAQFINKTKAPIITLNYDLMVEDLIYSTLPKDYVRANENYRGFYKAPIYELADRTLSTAYWAFSEGDEEGRSLPSVLKLHGSINWLWSGINPSDPVYCATGEESERLSSDLIPYIIPPVLDKNSFYNNNILKAVWRQAHEVISRAKEVYIIGFSFPQTDVSLKYLFQSALRNNRHTKIYVVDCNDSTEFKIRFNNLFYETQLSCNLLNTQDENSGDIV